MRCGAARCRWSWVERQKKWKTGKKRSSTIRNSILCAINRCQASICKLLFSGPFYVRRHTATDARIPNEWGANTKVIKSMDARERPCDSTHTHIHWSPKRSNELRFIFIFSKIYRWRDANKLLTANFIPAKLHIEPAAEEVVMVKTTTQRVEEATSNSKREKEKKTDLKLFVRCRSCLSIWQKLLVRNVAQTQEGPSSLPLHCCCSCPERTLCATNVDKNETASPNNNIIRMNKFPPSWCEPRVRAPCIPF